MQVNTKLLLSTSAVLMGLAGLVLLFAPREFLAALHVDVPPVLATMAQLHGILLVAFALVNWTAKDSLIGGIYNRPVALGNLAHFNAGALTLVKAAIAARSLPITIAAAVYVILGIAFATVVFFQSPVRGSV